MRRGAAASVCGIGAAFAGFAAVGWIEDRIYGVPNGGGDLVGTVLGHAPLGFARATAIDRRGGRRSWRLSVNPLR